MKTKQQLKAIATKRFKVTSSYEKQIGGIAAVYVADIAGTKIAFSDNEMKNEIGEVKVQGEILGYKFYTPLHG